MAVVCAGAKSILDIPRTLEFLETQGVCVAAFQSDEFPAFFTPSSGCKAPCRVEDPQQAAGLVASSLQLGLGSGILIGESCKDLTLLHDDGMQAYHDAAMVAPHADWRKATREEGKEPAFRRKIVRHLCQLPSA